MLSNYNYTDTSVGDLSAKKMEEETNTKGDGGCCPQLERRLKAGLLAMQLEIEESKREREEYIRELKECIALRDEQLTAAFEQIRERDNVIKETGDQANVSERRIEELTETVQQLMNAREKEETVQVSRRKRSQQAPLKAQQFEVNFKAEAFTSHYVMTMAVPGAKLAMNSYQIKQEMIEKLGTKIEEYIG